jgi:hypothetical protein
MEMKRGCVELRILLVGIQGGERRGGDTAAGSQGASSFMEPVSCREITTGTLTAQLLRSSDALMHRGTQEANTCACSGTAGDGDGRDSSLVATALSVVELLVEVVPGLPEAVVQRHDGG